MENYNKETLQLIAVGLTHEESAAKLNIPTPTFTSRAHQVLLALGAINQLHAIRLGIQTEFITRREIEVKWREIHGRSYPGTGGYTPTSLEFRVLEGLSQGQRHEQLSAAIKRPTRKIVRTIQGLREAFGVQNAAFMTVYVLELLEE